MSAGDKVYIWDTQSDLFIRAGEILQIEGIKALVMIISGKKDKRRYIVDWFRLDKLHLVKKGGRDGV